MNIREIRQQNLRRLIAGVGSVKTVAEKSGTNADWLSALASSTPPLTPAGTPRGIGNRLARSLEKGCGKPDGWMDTRHNFTDVQRMWMDRFADMPQELQEKALEHLEMLYKAHQYTEKSPQNGPDDASNDPLI